MITKRDWKKFVRKVWTIENSLNKSLVKYDFTLNGEEIIQADIINDVITCWIAQGDFGSLTEIREYRHPDSFRSRDPDLKILKGALRLEVFASGLDEIAKVVKTR